MAHRSAAAIAAIVWGIALHGCSSEDKQDQEPGTDEPAGVVVAASGQVSAARADQPARTLAVGAEVFRDDTVTTAADGSVAIELGHNRVTWNLAGGQSMRVDQSLAWKAKPASGSSSFDERAEMVTSSAGQHGGREAAVDSFALDGVDHAAEERAEGSAEAPAVAAAVPNVEQPEKARANTSRKKGSGGGPPGGGALAQHDSDTRAQKKLEVHNAFAGDDKAVGRRPEEAPAPPEPESEPDSDREVAGAGAAAAASSAPVPGTAILPAPRIGKVAVHEGDRKTAALIEPLRSRLSGCRADKASGRLMLSLTIAADGRVTSAKVSSVRDLSSDTRACIVANARKLKYPGAKAVARATVEIRFQ